MILVLSAIVFQLGRHNVKVLERAATLNSVVPRPGGGLSKAFKSFTS